MRLVLSTAAAADYTLDELLASCARRGLGGLELVAGHAHRVGTELKPASLEAIRSQIAAFLAPLDVAFHSDAARLSVALGAPVVAARADVAPSDATVLAAAAMYARAGGTLLMAHGSELEEIWRLRGLIEEAPATTLGLAWQVAPADEDITNGIPTVLDAGGPHLRHVRLLGGGPEAAQHEGRGIGSLMASLALRGYDGSLALAPSTPRYGVAWDAWLGRGGGWGCGSKTADPSLVRLAHSHS